MGLTKGRSIRRHNKKQTKRYKGNKYNGGGLAEGDLPPNATDAEVARAVKQFKGLDAEPAMHFMEDHNRRGGVEFPWKWLGASLVLGTSVFVATALLIDK